MSSKKSEIIVSRHAAGHATYGSYATGFILSIVLTLIPFAIVLNEWLRGWSLVLCLMFFAVLQLMVQLQFFIHLGHDPKPRWNKLVFVFMALVLLIVVLGSLWIMKNLNYHMKSPSEINTYIEHEELIKK